MRDYDVLATFERDGFTVIVDKTWEDLSPRDLFEAEDADEICRKIDSCELDWFMLRVRVMVEGMELAEEFLGGCCYEDAREVLVDGCAEDLIYEAMLAAKKDVYRLSRVFTELSNRVDAEGVTV